LPGAEVRVKANVGPDEIDDGVRIRVDRRTRDIGIPKVGCGEGKKTIQICPIARAHHVAGAILATAPAAVSTAAVASGAQTAAVVGSAS